MLLLAAVIADNILLFPFLRAVTAMTQVFYPARFFLVAFYTDYKFPVRMVLCFSSLPFHHGMYIDVALPAHDHTLLQFFLSLVFRPPPQAVVNFTAGVSVVHA
jgi:hypothetical protein